MTTAPRMGNKPRPVNLNLTTMHFPVTAIASILHRISGVILFLFLPFLLWVLSRSLASPNDFAAVQTNLQLPVIKFFVWAFLAGLTYHMLAGIRHLIMDLGLAESLRGGRLGAWFVIGLAILFAVMLGVWLW